MRAGEGTAEARGQGDPVGKDAARPMVVAYVLLRFPYLTETFIADEASALQGLGVPIRIVSLLGPRPGPVQPLSRRLQREAWYAPGLLSPGIWRAQAHFLRKSPRLYLRLLLDLLRCPCAGTRQALKRILIFLKSVAVAYRFRAAGISVFHSHFAGLSGAGAAVCARLLGRPFTVTVHAYDLFVRQGLLGYVLERAAHVVCVSRYNAERILSLRLCAGERVSVIRCGLDLSEFPYRGRAGSGRGSRQDPIRILSVGSLIVKKGHKHLIDACGLLRDRGVSFACSIIGAGPEERNLRRQVGSHGLESRVALMGARTRPEVIEAYAQHDLFVLACVEAEDGDKDGIPVVLMEAGATGLPMISTGVSGIPELIADRRTGLLVAPGDPLQLADAVLKVAGGPELAESLSRSARRRVEEEFDIRRNAASLKEVFIGVSAEAGAAADRDLPEDFLRRAERPCA
ncbi:MAG: glycosyltransferase [bacterium]